jgi:hypothetical protein
LANNKIYQMYRVAQFFWPILIVNNFFLLEDDPNKYGIKMISKKTSFFWYRLFRNIMRFRNYRFFSRRYFEIFIRNFSLEKFSIKSWSRVVRVIFWKTFKLTTKKTLKNCNIQGKIVPKRGESVEKEESLAIFFIIK